MITKTSLWPELERLLKEQQLELYDLDLPEGEGGTLRLYITGKESVGLEHCSQVSKLIARDEKLADLLEHYSLEVSTPGINRRLSRSEHFSSAIGERVKITLKKLPSKPGAVFVGKLLSFENDCLQVADEASKQTQAVELKNISKARIDFLFD